MEKNVPTFLKNMLCNSLLLGKQNTILPFTTLNQKLAIQENTALNPNDRQVMKYWCLGKGGLSVQTGTDGFVYTTPYVHKPTDTGLFSEIPFLVRPVDSDIVELRSKYRLRKLVNHGGDNYFAYYGKVLDLDAVTTLLQMRSAEPDGSVGVEAFEPDNTNLNPVPTVLSTGVPVTTNGDYVDVSSLLETLLGPQDILELLNACELLYGNQNHAVISEVALVAGADRQVTSTAGSVSATYNEVIAAQVMCFLATNFPAPSYSTGVKWAFDVGNSEPLLTVTPP